jgi:hypothetical protein
MSNPQKQNSSQTPSMVGCSDVQKIGAGTQVRMLVQLHKPDINYRELVSNIEKTSKRAGLPTKQYLRRRKPLSLEYDSLLTYRYRR